MTLVRRVVASNNLPTARRKVVIKGVEITCSKGPTPLVAPANPVYTSASDGWLVALAGMENAKKAENTNESSHNTSTPASVPPQSSAESVPAPALAVAGSDVIDAVEQTYEIVDSAHEALQDRGNDNDETIEKARQAVETESATEKVKAPRRRVLPQARSKNKKVPWVQALRDLIRSKKVEAGNI